MKKNEIVDSIEFFLRESLREQRKVYIKNLKALIRQKEEKGERWVEKERRAGYNHGVRDAISKFRKNMKKK